MKKIVALLLSLIMILSISVPTMAEKTYKTLAGYDLSNTTIEFWNHITGSDNECLTRWIDKFNAENEYGITIHQDSMDDEVLSEKLPVALASGNGPQMVLCGLSVPAYANDGLILELSDIFKYTDLKREDFIDGLLDLTSFEGGLYGLPFYIGVTYLFWNKDVYRQAGLDPDRAPQSWDEMFEYCKAIQKLGDNYYGLCFPYEYCYSVYDIMGCFGGKFVSVDPETGLYKNEIYSQENLDALKMWARFYQEKYNPVSPDETVFYAGIVGTLISGPWAGGTAEEYGIDVGYGLAPGTKDRSVYYCACENMNITNNAKTMEEILACYVWMAYWNSVEPCVDCSLSLHAPVYLKAALHDERILKDEKLASVSDFEGRTAWNWIPVGFTKEEEMNTLLTSMFEAIAMGGDVEECLKNASEAIDKIVEEANAEKQTK